MRTLGIVALFVLSALGPVAAGAPTPQGVAPGTTDPGPTVGVSPSTCTGVTTAGKTATGRTRCPAVTAGRTVHSEEPSITAVLPNPSAEGDRGEFVVVSFPATRNLSGWTLSDGEDTVELPGRTANGSVVVSPDPAAVRNRSMAAIGDHHDRTVVGVDALALSNGGERLRLAYRNVTVDTLAYEDAPEREIRRAGEWHPVGATALPVYRRSARSVRAFVLPDDPGVPLDVVRSAERRILLAGYSFGSRRVADALVRAADRGVRVRVLVDAAPVGGMTRRSARILDSLVAAGVEVRVFGADGRAPYDFHHPKYAVVDDRTLVATENWKPAGTGGHSSRGWGVVVDSAAVAADVAGIFRADARRPKALAWSQYRDDAALRSGSPANGSYPTRFRPRRLPVEAVRVLAAPDNAERAVVGLLDNATESVRVEQVSIGNGSFLRATVAAARRGVRVRVLLSQAWYVREENRRLVERLNDRARREGLDLQARLVEPRSRFEKVHAKGVIVDGDRVVVGSLNWNEHSARENRELAVVLVGDRVGGYYADLFRADWNGGAWWVPGGAFALLAVAIVAAIAVARRNVGFDASADPAGVGPGLY